MFQVPSSKFQDKGVSAFVAFAVMTTLLLMVFGLVSIISPQIKMTGEVGKSVIAFHAADSGIERLAEAIFVGYDYYDYSTSPYGQCIEADIVGSPFVTCECEAAKIGCFGTTPGDCNNQECWECEKGNDCPGEKYCRETNHSCYTTPVCQLKKDDDFGTDNVESGLQVEGCDEACQYCDAGKCKFYTSGQHGCETGYECDSTGQCRLIGEAVVEFIDISNLIGLDQSLYVESGSKCYSLAISGTQLSVNAILAGDYFSLETAAHKVLKLTPVGGMVTEFTFDSAYYSTINESISQWTETSSVSVTHIAGVPAANTEYQVKVGGEEISGSPFLSNPLAEITFTRTGKGFPEIFTIIEEAGAIWNSNVLCTNGSDPCEGIENNTQVPKCEGTCQACQSGSCGFANVDTDPGDDCGEVSCEGYYYGWQGLTCYKSANVPAEEAHCNGAGSCKGAADYCPYKNGKTKKVCDYANCVPSITFNDSTYCGLPSRCNNNDDDDCICPKDKCIGYNFYEYPIYGSCNGICNGEDCCTGCTPNIIANYLDCGYNLEEMEPCISDIYCSCPVSGCMGSLEPDAVIDIYPSEFYPSGWETPYYYTLPNGAIFETYIKKSNLIYSIESIGTYQGVKRAIEISF